MKRYLVMTIRRPTLDPAMVQPHKDYLEGLRAGGRIELCGAFSDQSGGAYILHAEHLEEAQAIAHADPGHLSGGWDITVYEWLAR